MSQSVLNVRMDESVKKQFDSLCSDFGMNASVAVNLFAKAVIRERKIPFDIVASDDPFYSEANQRRLRKSIEQLEHGKGTMHELIEVDDE